MTEHAEVVVVGAGFAGIAAAIELREAGHEVVIVERADRVGGTWRENVYPGVACDVPSHLYSLARHPSASWSAEFAPGGEIQTYLEDVVDREGLRSVIRFGSALQDASWSECDRQWRLALSGGGPTSADVLVMAAGRLTEPRVPAIAGIDGFARAGGHVMHSARWAPGTAVGGRRVAVIGTGSSAAQLVPELASRGADITLFQRTPAWVLPRGGRAYSAAERQARGRDAGRFAALRRQALESEGESFAARSGQGAPAERARRAARAHLEAQVTGPALRAALSPDYPFGCKRVVLSDDFYPAVASPAVTLEPSALVAAQGRDLIAASGARHQGIDLLVFATGFEAARQPYAELIRGDAGMTLAEHWAGGMTAAASTVVAGFPNLFVLGGPHAALVHTSSLLVLEQQAAFVRRALAERAMRGGVLRVDPAAERAYTALIEERTAGRPWRGGCTSWYLDAAAGRVTLIWPGTVAEFSQLMASAVEDVYPPVPAREPAASGGTR